jgi:hypothetical protein
MRILFLVTVMAINISCQEKTKINIVEPPQIIMEYNGEKCNFKTKITWNNQRKKYNSLPKGAVRRLFNASEYNNQDKWIGQISYSNARPDYLFFIVLRNCDQARSYADRFKSEMEQHINTKKIIILNLNAPIVISEEELNHIQLPYP